MAKIIAPSILTSDFTQLGATIDMLEKSRAEWIHLDIMDGLFVPNISFGFQVIESIRPRTEKVLDTHLMIVEPERYIERFAEAGADIITVHCEATENLKACLRQINECGVRTGVSIKPNTPITEITPYLPMLDLVLVMSVEPGFGGQSFMPHSLDKVRALREAITECGSGTLIEIDGGINLQNAPLAFEAGCDALVVGNTVFAAPDPIAMIDELLA